MLNLKKIFKISLLPILNLLLLVNIFLMGLIKITEFLLNYTIVILNDYLAEVGNKLDNYINDKNNVLNNNIIPNEREKFIDLIEQLKKSK